MSFHAVLESIEVRQHDKRYYLVQLATATVITALQFNCLITITNKQQNRGIYEMVNN